MLEGSLHQVPPTPLCCHQKCSGGAGQHTAVLSHTAGRDEPFEVRAGAGSSSRDTRVLPSPTANCSSGPASQQLSCHQGWSSCRAGALPGGRGDSRFQFIPEHGRIWRLFPHVPRRDHGPPASRCWSTIGIVLPAWAGSWRSAAASLISSFCKHLEQILFGSSDSLTQLLNDKSKLDPGSPWLQAALHRGELRVRFRHRAVWERSWPRGLVLEQGWMQQLCLQHARASLTFAGHDTAQSRGESGFGVTNMA